MTDPLDLLRAANPVADPGRDLDEAEARRVLDAALAAPLEPERRPRAARRRRRPLVLAPVALVLAGAVAGLVALVSGLGSGDVQPPQSRAAIVLDRTARAAETSAQAGADLAPGQYLYVRERNTYMVVTADAHPGPYTALQSHTRETWTNRDGDGEYLERSGARPEFVGPRDRRRWEAGGRPAISGPTPRGGERQAIHHGLHFANEPVTYEQLAGKPTDGHGMYEALKSAGHGAGNSPDEEVFVSVGDLLRTSPVPAKIRAALYRALAYVKGIHLAGAVRDREGRRGLAVELTGADGMRHQLVFDPGTSRLLAEQDVLVTPNDYVDAKPGTVLGYRVVLQAAVVDHAGARP
jgi:hypothetical protein